MHLHDFQESLKRGLVEAVSVRALTIGFLLFGRVKPHFIGKADRFPRLLDAITGTISVGRISPEVFTGLANACIILSTRTDVNALSNIFVNAGMSCSK